MPCPLDYGPWRRTRDSNPATDGFAGRLPPPARRAPRSRQESNLLPAGPEPAVPSVALRELGCAGEDSNLRVGCLIYSQVRSPLRH